MLSPHDSASTHVTGKSEFIDDRPVLPREVFCQLVYSPHARAEIVKIETKAAFTDPTVIGVFTAQDLAHNRWGTIFQDQPVLAENEVQYVGEVVCVVAATTQASAVRAAKRIQISYRPLEAILSIDAAKERKSFIGDLRFIRRGDFDGAFKSAPRQLAGQVTLRGQDHFYLESHAAIAYPKEDGQIEIHSSSQHPTEVQHVVAHALGLSSKDIVVVVKRMGGAFGGKESQAAPMGAYAALVAQKLQRPARLVLTKDDDMILTGKRNPFQNEYQVGFTEEGKILALAVNLFSDGGAYADLSTAIMERAMLHCDNAYFIQNVRIAGQVCRTNYHPHTAFRGFGGPKGVATIEKILEEIAHALGKDPLEIRKLNCYKNDGVHDTTPYGQRVENNLLPTLFETLEKKANYRKRRQEIQQHNQKALEEGREPLRGLSMTAVKFGISFTTRFLNQGNALVVIHRDGTVQVSTGATEMGQGVNARIAQVVADELGLARDRVRVMSTSTEKNANTSPTAASSGTDLNAGAALLATRKIKSRLSQLAKQLLEIPEKKWARHCAGMGTQPEIQVSDAIYQASHPNEGADWKTGVQTFEGIVFEKGQISSQHHPGQKISFHDLTVEAYLNRISLSDYAHYRFPGLSFNKLTGNGKAFLYYTQGVALSEVSVDPGTGEVKVLRVDILMDLGRPIHQELDLGQVYGGFVQGMGWVTTEKLVYSPEGALLSHSPSTYKIPSVQDMPRVFNAELIPNEGNTANLKGTKAVGEPPLLLAISVWTAISDAVKNLPHYKTYFPQMELPATQEEVLRAMHPARFQELDAMES